MEGGRVRRGGKWHVQSRYRLLLNPSDLVALSGREALPAELADTLREHARRRGYVLDARPSVRLEVSQRVNAGDVVVLTDDDGPSAAAASHTADPPPAAQQAVPAQPPRPSGPSSTQHHLEQPPAGSTNVYSAARPTAPRATLAVRAPGQPVVRRAVDGTTLRIGRASDNEIVLADSRVSRHHAQISVRLGTLIYTDLNSTNGSYLQGSRVQEIALGPHDVIQLGGSTLTIEPAQ